MCGIAGIVALNESVPPPTHAQVSAMCNVMVHRGPDDAGIDICGQVGLGMRRLSIIDLVSGHQPIFNEDRSVRVVLNGEIYNYRELQRDLERKGHRFATASDTEVLVHLWEEVGYELPKYLNGMFAFVLYDMKRQRVLLARDQLGIKPLFYTMSNRYLVFGSEIKAILESGLVERQLDVDALGQFLAWEYVPGPATLFRDVHKLQPATSLELHLIHNTSRFEQYWDAIGPVDVSRNGSLSRPVHEWEDEVDATLRTCVQRQLVSDVPLGAFLSGGVDSSLIVAAMGPHAKTFSIGFDDPTYNEVPWSQRVARHIGVDHNFEVVKPSVINLFDQLMHFMDDPIGDFSIFPTYLVSQLARNYVKVALSGDGGDELFGGYETYLAQETARLWQRLPTTMRHRILEPAIVALPPSRKKKGFLNRAKRFVEGLEHSPALGHARWRIFAGIGLQNVLFTSEARASLLTPTEQHITELYDRAHTRDATDRALYADLRSYLVDNCLVKVDRMSMACSLETRVPFLDPELVELAFRIPSHHKVRSGTTKILLKHIACRHMPKQCAHRPKEGFSMPIKHWLRTEFRPLLEELLSPHRIQEAGLFDPTCIERLKREHMDNTANHSHVLWSLMVFEDWRTRWKVTT